jgi:hypothetical protein
MDKVEEFIHRRFKTDCNWTGGNCYYFALILKDRFPKGKIVYEVIDGHFMLLYRGHLYDFKGKHEKKGKFVDWETFDEYDANIKRKVIKGCLM